MIQIRLTADSPKELAEAKEILLQHYNATPKKHTEIAKKQRHRVYFLLSPKAEKP